MVFDEKEVQKRAVANSEASEKIRKSYDGTGIYKPETICRKLDVESATYVDKLLQVKLDIVRSIHRDGPVLDLCCATGSHLFELTDLSDECVGVDFSDAFISAAQKEAQERQQKNARFLVGDAKDIPLPDSSVSTVYSLSSLYAIPGVEDVVSEISRVLQPGGRCLLDMGNSRSLNTYCLRHYPEIPETFPIKPSAMLSSIEAAGMRIVDRRAFQLLPLWAGKPSWLWPLLHPRWNKIMAKSFSGKMLDEWVSNLPGVREISFRQLIVCEKVG